MEKVLVTPRSVTQNGHPALNAIAKAGYNILFSTPGCFPAEEELLEKIPDCVGYLAGVERITAKVLDAAVNLKVISRNGTGVENIDLAAAERNDIKVCRAEGSNATGVAELTMGFIIALVRSIPFSDHAMKSEKWERQKGVELEGRTLGLIGCGRIGQHVARFASGFNMKVMAYDPNPSSEMKSLKNFLYVNMDELLKKAEIISLHCPPLADNKALIDEKMIYKMQDGIYLVNTSRGGLLDDDAVSAGLNSGKISGAAIDAFIQEPPDDWRLVKHSRVISTPHIGGFTSESIDRAMAAAVDNLLEALK